jgi:general stress protein 26
MPIFDPADIQRLETERNLWLASVRPNGSPHLVPIWFVWHDDKAFLCTSRESVKARNISKNPNVVFALQDGDNPLVIQAAAQILDEVPKEVTDAFKRKFDWDIQGDKIYNAVVELTPVSVVL